jgi:hypothetical protein
LTGGASGDGEEGRMRGRERRRRARVSPLGRLEGATRESEPITIDLKGYMLNSEHAGGDWRVPQFNGALLSTSLLQIKKRYIFSHRINILKKMKQNFHCYKYTSIVKNTFWNNMFFHINNNFCYIWKHNN